MTIESEDDLEALRKIGKIVANTLAKMMESVEPGMTTLELDAIGAAELAKHGARSAPVLTYRFPGHTCISVNNEAAHGIPSTKKIAAGDLVNIDVSAELDGYFADTGGTIIVPPIKASYKKLCDATREAMWAGIQAARSGAKLSNIGKAIERVARKNDFAIVENLASHGVGRALHEEPAHILSYFDPAEKRVLKKGMVITCEPFLSTGPRDVQQHSDGWTLFVNQKHRTAQYEHTIVITDDEPIVITPNGYLDLA